MKLNAYVLAGVLAAALGSLSMAPLHAQSTPSSCPKGGMMHGGMMMHEHAGMMHGPADQAYMRSMMGMHQGMEAHPMTGDADHDFMAMMIPHHQAAINMAKAELQYGKNAKLRAMAQNIIKTQQAEIDQMRAMMK
jgi:uncharacterized protein (DUF305 family)